MAITDYEAFDLLIARGSEHYRARMLASPAGNAAADFTLPFDDDELESFLWETVGPARRLGAARRGKLLLTSRYPLPAGGEWLAALHLGPLSPAETRRLFQRLPALAGGDPALVSAALRFIGGHPRTLEYLDARLRQAAAEPARADTAWDLVVSLFKVSQVDVARSRAHLGRALAILRALHAAGSLYPQQVEAMRQLEERER